MPDDKLNLNFDQWSEIARPFFRVKRIEDGRGFEARADMKRFDRLILSNVSFAPMLFEHDPSRLKTFDNDYLLFEKYLSGSNRGMLEDISTRLEAGSMHLVDMSRRYQVANSRTTCLSVVIPHYMIDYAPSRHRPYFRLSASSPRGRILDTALQVLFDAQADEDEAQDLAMAFVGLVRQLMLGEANEAVEKNLEKTTFLLIRAHINRAIADPDLTVERLCRDFHISRATLYRMFAAEGGVLQYIMDRRLDRCFAEFCGSPATRGRVGEVANRWAFTDAAHFNKRFKRRFGVAPSDCLNSEATLPVDSGSIFHSIHHWMRKL